MVADVGIEPPYEVMSLTCATTSLPQNWAYSVSTEWKLLISFKASCFLTSSLIFIKAQHLHCNNLYFLPLSLQFAAAVP